ncbi:hypothetical protein PPTG_21408 [Phytophthora nicotianae INRA-310]|uniref:Uncharacterized protein n=6 Tax=Phytophthora nicotianae TaxID=4792 RepID=W2R151_PHYN3|nr:hypothetical protein PPTG_21408 [Phytophthora nicotianae INRA-310]ETN19078.1 hypothetical protein PPTG_21408 [Phytophthora nicotianae INRA-310]
MASSDSSFHPLDEVKTMRCHLNHSKVQANDKIHAYLIPCNNNSVEHIASRQYNQQDSDIEHVWS